MVPLAVGYPANRPIATSSVSNNNTMLTGRTLNSFRRACVTIAPTCIRRYSDGRIDSAKRLQPGLTAVACESANEVGELVREVLDRIGDEWSALLIGVLQDEP